MQLKIFGDRNDSRVLALSAHEETGQMMHFDLATALLTQERHSRK